MPFVNPKTIERQRAMAQALSNRPQGRGRYAGIGNALRQFGGYRGGVLASEQEEENKRIQDRERNMLMQALRGQPITDQGVGPLRSGELPQMQSPVGDVAMQFELQKALQAAKPADFNKPFLPSGDPNTAFQEYQKDLREAGKTDINVNTGKGAVEAFTTTSLESLSDTAATARNRQNQATTGLNLLQKRVQSGNETGKWAPMQTEMSAWLGVDPEGVATAQIFDVKMGDKVMSRIQQTKGAVSEREMAYFSKISPGSDKEPFTNYVLLEIDRRASIREQDKMKYVEEYMNANNNNLIGFDQWYMENKDPFPGFDVDTLRADFDQWAQPELNEGWRIVR